MGNRKTRRHAEWAQRKRDELIDALGRKCATPNCKTPFRKLEIDHIYGRDWEPREMSQAGRVRRYLRESKEGLLQVLCSKCNKRKGKPSNRPKSMEPVTQEAVNG